jgi:hypothetical protein
LGLTKGKKCNSIYPDGRSAGVVFVVRLVNLIGKRVEPSIFGLDALATFCISDCVPEHSAFYAISQKPKKVKVSGVMKPKILR